MSGDKGKRRLLRLRGWGRQATQSDQCLRGRGQSAGVPLVRAGIERDLRTARRRQPRTL